MGIAETQSDSGKYYGIWSEITSKNMLCSDISNNLTAQALELPLIEKQKEVKEKKDSGEV